MAEAINEKVKFQIFYEKKLKELYMSIYPTCMEQCESFYPKEDERLVLTKEVLLCAQNCLQKHKSSMTLAL